MDGVGGSRRVWQGGEEGLVRSRRVLAGGTEGWAGSRRVADHHSSPDEGTGDGHEEGYHAHDLSQAVGSNGHLASECSNVTPEWRGQYNIRKPSHQIFAVECDGEPESLSPALRAGSEARRSVGCPRNGAPCP